MRQTTEKKNPFAPSPPQGFRAEMKPSQKSAQQEVKLKETEPMETSKKTKRINFDDIGMSFVVVAWGGMLLSVFLQVL